ncbi:APC family permease [Streptomyces sp. NPDC017254]|uniref:APC family permease n=1 Tax=unclassified Streptomyces TaxID=2593676 RepID=UPI0037A39810
MAVTNEGHTSEEHKPGAGRTGSPENISETASSELHKTLTVPKGVGVATGMIIGSGLLVLPGLAYDQVGPSAVYAWLSAAVVVLPLLVVFARLGARYPTAGGVQGFAQAAFGAPGSTAASVILIGACAFGGAAMAISGGNYVAALLGNAGAGGWVALAYLVIIGLLQAAGSRLAGGIQSAVTIGLLLLLALVAFAPAMVDSGSLHGELAPPAEWLTALPAVGLVFFAYTGWELVASTAEEYRNPKRDFPLVIGITFVIVVALYLGISLAVQLVVAPDDPLLSEAPVVAVLEQVLGDASGRIAAALGAAIIFATLMGGTWATSRIVFATARDGLLPNTLAKVDARSGAPRPAVLLSVLMFGGVVLANALDLISLTMVFQLSTVNFVIGYAISVLSYAKLYTRPAQRLLALVAGAPVLVMLAGFGWVLLYPAALLAFAVLVHTTRRRRAEAETSI